MATFWFPYHGGQSPRTKHLHLRDCTIYSASCQRTRAAHKAQVIHGDDHVKGRSHGCTIKPVRALLSASLVPGTPSSPRNRRAKETARSPGLRCQAPWAIVQRHALPGFGQNRETNKTSKRTNCCFTRRGSFHASESTLERLFNALVFVVAEGNFLNNCK